METIVEFFNTEKHFDIIAEKILEIYRKERAVDNFDYYFDEFGVMPSLTYAGFHPTNDETCIHINGYCYIKDEKEFTGLNVPFDWFDSFDEGVVIAHARTLFEQRMAVKREIKLEEQMDLRERELKKLRELMAKYPNEVNNFAT